MIDLPQIIKLELEDCSDAMVDYVEKLQTRCNELVAQSAEWQRLAFEGSAHVQLVLSRVDEYLDRDSMRADLMLYQGPSFADHDREIAARAVERAADDLASLVTAPAGIHTAAIIKLNLHANKIRAGEVDL